MPTPLVRYHLPPTQAASEVESPGTAPYWGTLRDAIKDGYTIHATLPRGYLVKRRNFETGEWTFAVVEV